MIKIEKRKENGELFYSLTIELKKTQLDENDSDNYCENWSLTAGSFPVEEEDQLYKLQHKIEKELAILETIDGMEVIIDFVPKEQVEEIATKTIEDFLNK